MYGIQTSYLDVRKQTRKADPESLLLILRAMGADVAAMTDVASALRARKAAMASQRVEPVIVAWDGKVAPGMGEIVLENGTRHDGKTRLVH